MNISQSPGATETSTDSPARLLEKHGLASMPVVCCDQVIVPGIPTTWTINALDKSALQTTLASLEVAAANSKNCGMIPATRGMITLRNSTIVIAIVKDGGWTEAIQDRYFVKDPLVNAEGFTGGYVEIPPEEVEADLVPFFGSDILGDAIQLICDDHGPTIFTILFRKRKPLNSIPDLSRAQAWNEKGVCPVNQPGKWENIPDADRFRHGPHDGTEKVCAKKCQQNIPKLCSEFFVNEVYKNCKDGNIRDKYAGKEKLLSHCALCVLKSQQTKPIDRFPVSDNDRDDDVDDSDEEDSEELGC